MEKATCTVRRWDFPMLAMCTARNGVTEKAIEWLLHPLFEFDDVGMPVDRLLPLCQKFSSLKRTYLL